MQLSVLKSRYVLILHISWVQEILLLTAILLYYTAISLKRLTTKSWLRSLNYVRNVVAHHSRLWNRNLIDQPKLGKQSDMPEFAFAIGNAHCTSRVYIILCILAHLMKYVSSRSSWSKRVARLIETFPQAVHVNIKDMGCPEGWTAHQFWV